MMIHSMLVTLFGHEQLAPGFIIQEGILETDTAIEFAGRGIVLLNLKGYLAAVHVIRNGFDFPQQRPGDPLSPEVLQHHKIMDVYQ